MNLILADSNELTRIGLRTIFSHENTCRIVEEARNSKELLASVSNVKDAIILLGLLHSINDFGAIAIFFHVTLYATSQCVYYCLC